MITTVVDGLDHPEGVAWGPDNLLYAGGEAGQLYRIDVDAKTVQQFGTTGGFVLGLALDAEGNVYACDSRHCAVMRITPAGEVSSFSAGTADRPMRTPNFPVFDKHGNLYVSDSGAWPAGGGCIYRIDPSGHAEIWSTATVNFANGLALSPDGDALYVVESVRPGVVRIPINADGSAGESELVVTLPGTVPDGLAFDQDSRLYISCYRPDRIYTLDRAGNLEIFAEDYQGTALAAPTNVAFGRENRLTLYIASLGRWHIAESPVLTPGAPLHYPVLTTGRS